MRCTTPNLGNFVNEKLKGAGKKRRRRRGGRLDTRKTRKSDLVTKQRLIHQCFNSKSPIPIPFLNQFQSLVFIFEICLRYIIGSLCHSSPVYPPVLYAQFLLVCRLLKFLFQNFQQLPILFYASFLNTLTRFNVQCLCLWVCR